MNWKIRSRTTTVTALCSALIVGCTVGPNFQKPAAPQVKGYTSTPPTTTASTTRVSGGHEQQFNKNIDIPGEWWTLFHSRPLNDLIERSLKTNPDIKAAQAALLIAQENVEAQKGAYFPQIGADANATRAKTSKDLSPVPSFNEFRYRLYTAQVAVSYVPDVFGLNRRTVESLQAQADQARFALAATHITLSTNVAAAAIQEASLRAQIEATRRLIDLNSKMLQILRDQLDKGLANRLDVAAQEAQLAQVVATLPPLEKQLAQQRDLIAALSGSFPDQDPPEKFELASLELPGELPLSLPSKLVEQRPDVRQAEENLHSASAQIGVAVANRLPNVTISANAGSSALALSRLFTPGVGFWTLAADVAMPLFDGGTLLHREAAARAAYVQAAEQYRGTVLTAFQNVADTLHALDEDANALKAASDAEAAAKVTLDIVQKQMDVGYVNYLILLNAEQTYQQTIINRVQAQANRYADTVALFQALGGGWWNRPDIPR